MLFGILAGGKSVKKKKQSWVKGVGNVCEWNGWVAILGWEFRVGIIGMIIFDQGPEAGVRK